MSRLKTSAIVAMFSVLLCLSAVAARAEEMAMPAGVKGEMLMWYKDAEGKIIQLAEATPEEKYAWRPSKDVRSTGEVFMHVVSANYGIPSFWGTKTPDGFNFATHEQSLTKKADIVAALKASFATMEQNFLNTSDADMDKPVDLFGMKTTERGGYLLLLSHAHEHLGQSIAYARMNGITPPWTAKQQEAIKAEAAKKKPDAK